MSEVLKFTILADDESKGAFKSFTGSLKTGVRVAKNLAVATVGTATAVVGFTTVVANHIDRQAKFAKRIGVSVESLTAYQFAANQAGINTDTFNMATQRMTRRVAEAAKGTGEAKDAIKDLGIDAREFQGIGLDKQMEVLADKMGGLTNEQDKLRLAFKLFDSEGTAVLQMLNDGSAAMREAANDARFLGLVIDKEAAAQTELFTEKMGRATGAMKGLSNSVAGELMPIIAGLADRFANFIASNRQNITDFVKGSIEGFFTVGNVIAQVWDKIGEILTDPKAFTEFIKSLHAMAVNVGVLALDISQALIVGILEGLTAAKNMFLAFGTWIGESLAKLITGQETDTIGEALAKVFVDGFAQAKEAVAGTLTSIADLTKDAAPEILENLTDAYDIDVDQATADAKAMIENLSLFAGSAKEEIAGVADETSAMVEAMKEQGIEFRTWLEESTGAYVESLRTTMQGTIDSLSAGLAAAITTGTSLMDVFKNVARQVVTSMIAALIKLGIQRAILATLSGKLVGAGAVQETSKAVGLAGANMFASMAAAPFPINLTAPAAAAAAVAGAGASFTAGAATGAALGGTIGLVAHGGLTSNPTEQTALIHRNERIISPRQNEDLTSFLNEGGSSGVAIENVNITMFPNATNADAVFELSGDELADSIGGSIIDALNNLDLRGIRPDFAEAS